MNFRSRWGVLDAVLHLELGRAVEVTQHGDCEIPFGHRNGVRDVLEEQHGLGDVHVDLLQFACLVLFLDLFDDPTSCGVMSSSSGSMRS